MPGAKVKKDPKKDEKPKMAPQGGQELINERQETMFQTDISQAADDYTKACKETTLWKEKLKHAGKELIEMMKKYKISTLSVGTTFVIKYKYVDAKETITLKDYKPAKRRRRSL